MTDMTIKMTFHANDDLTVENKTAMMAAVHRRNDRWVWDGRTLHLTTNSVLEALEAFELDGYQLEEFERIEITPFK